MKHRIISTRTIAILFFSFILVAFGETSPGKARSRKPKAGNPARHSFPAIGISAERKVQVAWNRFYDHAGLSAILSQLHKAFPELTKIYSIGKTTQGRDIWCLEVTARSVGDPDSGSCAGCQVWIVANASPNNQHPSPRSRSASSWSEGWV